MSDSNQVSVATTARPELSPEEEDIVARMFRLVGKRWHLIAGRIPGRTPEEIEKYWTSKFSSTSDQCSSYA